MSSVDITLFDINENKQLGLFMKDDDQTVPIMCDVGDRTCGSDGEWNGLIKPYMDD